MPVVVTATFTAEPLEAPLQFWLGELGIDGTIAFAPYHQVFQQLLDPTSLVGQIAQGVNIVLVRFEDWARFEQGKEARSNGLDPARRAAGELAAALRVHAERSPGPTIVCVCPSAVDTSPIELENQLRAGLNDLGSISWIGQDELDLYPVVEIFDARRDRIGHIPYTPELFTALGTALARRIHTLKAPPFKVIALDCDNTLWQGVVGEDGPQGIGLPPGKRALQEFVIQQQQAGMLACLVSKNVEECSRCSPPAPTCPCVASIS
jgi:hypothetical protein